MTNVERRDYKGNPLPLTLHVSHIDPVSLDLVVKRLAADAEAFRRFEFVSAGFLEHLDDGVAFDTLQNGEIGVRRLFVRAARFGDGKIAGIDFIPLAKEHSPLDLILQLTDVSGPIEGGQAFDRRRGEAFDDATVGLRSESF